MSHAFHGTGKWKLTKLFPTLNAMAACLAELGRIAEKLGERCCDEDGSLSEAALESAKERIEKLIESPSAAKKTLDVLEWR